MLYDRCSHGSVHHRFYSSHFFLCVMSGNSEFYLKKQSPTNAQRIVFHLGYWHQSDSYGKAKHPECASHHLFHSNIDCLCSGPMVGLAAPCKQLQTRQMRKSEFHAYHWIINLLRAYLQRLITNWFANFCFVSGAYISHSVNCSIIHGSSKSSIKLSESGIMRRTGCMYIG